MHNLKLLGLPLKRYAEEHDGRYPDMLAELDPDYYNDLRNYLVCTKVAAPSESRSIDAVSSYRLVKGLTNDAGPDTILAYETGSNHGAEGYAVLYADGRAMRLPGLPPELDTLP